jgi:hypothetical protein
MRLLPAITALAIAPAWLASAPLPAQTAVPRVARVGMLSDSASFGNPLSPADWVSSFRAGLRDAGYVEGRGSPSSFAAATGIRRSLRRWPVTSRP